MQRTPDVRYLTSRIWCPVASSSAGAPGRDPACPASHLAELFRRRGEPQQPRGVAPWMLTLDLLGNPVAAAFPEVPHLGQQGGLGIAAAAATQELVRLRASEINGCGFCTTCPPKTPPKPGRPRCALPDRGRWQRGDGLHRGRAARHAGAGGAGHPHRRRGRWCHGRGLGELQHTPRARSCRHASVTRDYRRFTDVVDDTIDALTRASTSARPTSRAPGSVGTLPSGSTTTPSDLSTDHSQPLSGVGAQRRPGEANAVVGQPVVDVSGHPATLGLSIR